MNEPPERCLVAREATNGEYYCTRAIGHHGPCAAWPVESPWNFGALIAQWLSRTTITDEELCKAFDVSRTTALRWREGHCKAHPALWPHILEFLALRLDRACHVGWDRGKL